MAVKVGLADIPEPAFSDWADRLLGNLILRSKKVKVKHEGDLSKVTLYNASYGGVHRLLNAEVSEGVPPNLLKDYFSGGDVIYKHWPDKLTGTVATIPGDSVQQFIFIGTPDDQLIKTLLAPEMKLYCEKLEIERHTPQVNEFVLVKLGADWYRAIATPKENMNNSAMVYFIDYGRDGEAQFENIRPIVREFVLAPASVKSCNLLGMPPSDTLPPEIVSKVRRILYNVMELVLLEEHPDEVPQTCSVWVPSIVDALADLGITYREPSDA